MQTVGEIHNTWKSIDLEQEFFSRVTASTVIPDMVPTNGFPEDCLLLLQSISPSKQRHSLDFLDLIRAGSTSEEP